MDGCADCFTVGAGVGARVGAGVGAGVGGLLCSLVQPTVPVGHRPLALASQQTPFCCWQTPAVPSTQFVQLVLAGVGAGVTVSTLHTEVPVGHRP